MKRSELYAAVWAEPISRLAQRLGCSDTWLRSICKSQSIPQPPRGYWGRVHGRQSVQRPPLPPGEDVDIGLQIRLMVPSAQSQALLSTGESKPSPRLPADDEPPPAAVDAPRPARFVAMLAHSLAHQRVRVMRQLYKDAKTWRRHREISDFLGQLASNVAYRDGPERAIVLRWIEQMREELQASDPIRICLERVVALHDPTDPRSSGPQPDAASGGSQGE